MKVATYTELCDMDFIGAKYLAGAADGVVRGMIEGVGVIHVSADFRSEELRIKGRVFCAGIAIEPRPVGEGEGFGGARWLRLSGRQRQNCCRGDCCRGGLSKH